MRMRLGAVLGGEVGRPAAQHQARSRCDACLLASGQCISALRKPGSMAVSAATHQWWRVGPWALQSRLMICLPRVPPSCRIVRLPLRVSLLQLRPPVVYLLRVLAGTQQCAAGAMPQTLPATSQRLNFSRTCVCAGCNDSVYPSACSPWPFLNFGFRPPTTVGSPTLPQAASARRNLRYFHLFSPASPQDTRVTAVCAASAAASCSRGLALEVGAVAAARPTASVEAHDGPMRLPAPPAMSVRPAPPRHSLAFCSLLWPLLCLSLPAS